jgi:O-antigen/teichoic acid export membrane protein
MQRATAVLRRSANRELWALGDQALVSAANFFTNVYLARCMGLKEYGHFVTFYALLLYLWAWQLALFISPSMSIAPQIEGAQPRHLYLRGVNTLQLLWALSSAIVTLFAGSLLRATHVFPLSWHEIVGFAGCVVAFQLQDGLRRYYFVCGNARAALINDAISYVGQVLLLILLYWSGRLHVATALDAVAITSGVAVAYGAVQESLLAGISATRDAMRRTWRMGRDLLMAIQLQWANSQGLLLIGAWFLGPQAAGAVRAMQSVAGPFNVLFQAMENVIPIRAAQHYAESRLAGLRHYLTRVMQGGALLLGVPLLLIVVFSRPLVAFVFGAQWTPFAVLLAWQAGYLFCTFFFRVSMYFFRTVECTGKLIVASSIMFWVSLAFLLLLVHRWQATAILSAMVIGLVCAMAYAAFQLWRFLSRNLIAAEASR